MKKLILLLLSCLVPMTIMACGEDTADTTSRTGIECDAPGVNCDENNRNGETVTLSLTAPDGTMVNFTADGVPIESCMGVNHCETQLDLSRINRIGIDCPTHLFLPKETADLATDGDMVVVTWLDNEWGLAPHGLYEEVETGVSYPLRTKITDGAIVLEGLRTEAAVIGTSFAGDNENGSSVVGTISNDLSTIEYTDHYARGERDVTLQLVDNFRD